MTSVLLPDPDAPVMATSCPSGKPTSTALRLFSRAPRTVRTLPLPLRRFFGIAIERLPERNCPVGEALHASTSIDRSLNDDRAAVDARAGPHLDDMVRGANRVLVVLDDDDRVADVAEPLERRDHLDVVLRVQADARLVQHVEHAHQPRADLGRQPDALRFSARERAERRLKLR